MPHLMVTDTAYTRYNRENVQDDQKSFRKHCRMQNSQHTRLGRCQHRKVVGL
jgi:hypothetical protein